MLWPVEPHMERPPSMYQGNWLWMPKGSTYMGPLSANALLGLAGKTVDAAYCHRRFRRDLEIGEKRRLP